MLSSKASCTLLTAIGPKRLSYSISSARLFSASAQAMDIKIFREVPALRAYRHELRDKKRSVGLVPTMGALHSGHLSLAKAACKDNEEVFMSIYVNPTQFGINEDLDSYPRTWDSDLAQLRQLNETLDETDLPGRVTAVFAPTTKVMYPTLPPTSEIDGQGSFVTITPLGKLLEGSSRPVFFRGVATVCMKLFNIVNAENAYFGQKDVQQSVLIRRLITDFHLDTKLHVMPTEREHDGLAMSSRNVYLGSRRRAAAVVLPDALRLAEATYISGNAKRENILSSFTDVYMAQRSRNASLRDEERVLFELDYVSLADPDTMQEIDAVDENKGAILSAALKMLPLEYGLEDCPGEGKMPVRLIDNLILPARA